MRVRLDAIAFDAGTQIRAALDQQVVTDYAEQMTAGATFPPIVLFHDGNQHYLADGFHRFMAAQRNQCRDIEAEVQPGTKEDALWFALGANKANGKRLTDADKHHAITLALDKWPDRSGRDLAAHIGCDRRYVDRVREERRQAGTIPHVERVRGKDGKQYPLSSKPARPADERMGAIRDLVKAGKSNEAIVEAIGAKRHDLIAVVRRELGIGEKPDRTRAAIAERRERMRSMAASGHTSRQIAATLGLSENGCRVTLRAEGIDVPADKATKGTHRHDANRIVDQIVMDAANLTEGVNLVDFSSLDRDRIGDWADSLVASRRALDGFIKRLLKERQTHEAA